MNGQFNTELDDSGTNLTLEYIDSNGTTKKIHQWLKFGNRFVRFIDIERYYNYSKEQWCNAHRFTHDYDLADDGQSLAGDGSNWSGTGQKWDSWAKERHKHLCSLRFPYDT